MVYNLKRGALFLCAAALLLLTACGTENETANPQNDDALLVQPLLASVSSIPEPTSTPEPAATPKPWTDDELKAMAQTLSGECYDDKAHDKRLVCEVILNRVGDGRFGDSIVEVITAENQFLGYWNPSRPISDNDLAIAEQTLDDWFDNDCEALSTYLYFSAGSNRENTFYEDIEW